MDFADGFKTKYSKAARTPTLERVVYSNSVKQEDEASAISALCFTSQGNSL
jgi:hypothetical protein